MADIVKLITAVAAVLSSAFVAAGFVSTIYKDELKLANDRILKLEQEIGILKVLLSALQDQNKGLVNDLLRKEIEKNERLQK